MRSPEDKAMQHEADRFEIEYDFEEIRIIGDGMMADGTAVLVHDGDGEFYVDRIVISGKLIDRAGSGFMGFPSTFNKVLFEVIAIQIEKSDDAQRTFAAAISEYRAGCFMEAAE